MAKYRVVTDNLDWLGLFPRNIVYQRDDKWAIQQCVGDSRRIIIDYKPFANCIKTHPEWFQLLEDEFTPTFTKEDMINFASEWGYEIQRWFVFFGEKPKISIYNSYDSWLNKRNDSNTKP